MCSKCTYKIKVKPIDLLPRFLLKRGPSPPQQVLTPPINTTQKLVYLELTYWLANVMSIVSQSEWNPQYIYSKKNFANTNRQMCLTSYIFRKILIYAKYIDEMSITLPLKSQVYMEAFKPKWANSILSLINWS